MLECVTELSPENNCDDSETVEPRSHFPGASEAVKVAALHPEGLKAKSETCNSRNLMKL